MTVTETSVTPPLSDSERFDYDQLPDGMRQRVYNRTVVIRGLIKTTLNNLIAVGQELTAQKADLNHGQWESWLKMEFPKSQRTAENYMAAADKFATVAFLPIDPKAAYYLSGKSIPDSACTEAIERAKTGETISYEVAQEIVIGHEQPIVIERATPNPLPMSFQRLKDPLEIEATLHLAQSTADIQTKGHITPTILDVSAEKVLTIEATGGYVPNGNGTMNNAVASTLIDHDQRVKDAIEKKKAQQGIDTSKIVPVLKRSTVKIVGSSSSTRVTLEFSQEDAGKLREMINAKDSTFELSIVRIYLPTNEADSHE